MGRKITLDQSVLKVEAYFDNSINKAFTEYKFAQTFHEHKRLWNLSEQNSPAELLAYLLSKDLVHAIEIADKQNKKRKIYSWKTRDELSVLSGIKQNSYFAYFTALSLHDLTLQIPKTIYLNFEHSAPVDLKQKKNILSQDSIDAAFSKQQRKSSNHYTYRDKKIVLTNSQYTNQLGLIRKISDNENYQYTDLERTLIDIAVRPVYSGGVFEVKEAYIRARNKVDVVLLKKYLEKLNYTYPYHQVIGFYLEKCGFGKEEIELFNTPKEHDFYLTYNIRNKNYSPKWKIYYPDQF